MISEREMMPSPPSGLCACRLDGEYVHIAAISPRTVILRLPDEILPAGALTLQLYLPEQGVYETHTLYDYSVGAAQHQQDAVLLRLSFEDAACANAIRRTMNAYARYLETKSTLGACAYAADIAAYPWEQDECFMESLQQQRKAWFSCRSPLPCPGDGTSLAVELNCPELWQMYINLPLPQFMHAYACSRELPPGLLPNRLPDRLYIGNPFCRHLFPDDAALSAILEKARQEGLGLTIVTAELRTGGEDIADKRIALAGRLEDELMVNDWGMLQRAKGKCRILLGPLLNRRRRDPRMKYKPGMDASLLRGSSLNSDSWQSFLSSMGVSGYAWDACTLPEALPPGINSLHLPFYQTNTALWCPLQALCLSGNRGSQQPADECGLWCSENVLLYPAHLNLVGRWNSILALAEDLSAADLQQFDRWVLNF